MVELDPVTADPTDLRRLYGYFPSGVTAVCALSGEVPVGMAASAFTAVSIDPPLVSVCVQNSSTTWPKLRGLRRLGVSVLAQHQHRECRTLAMKEGDRFAGIDWVATPGGAIVVSEATAWLECSLYSELVAGDHAIALLEVHAFRIDLERSPLVFHESRFRKLANIVEGSPR